MVIHSKSKWRSLGHIWVACWKIYIYIVNKVKRTYDYQDHLMPYMGKALVHFEDLRVIHTSCALGRMIKN